MVFHPLLTKLNTMKKLTLLSLVIIFSVSLHAQNWIGQGATWHYDFWTIGYHGFFKYNYVGDTLIEGNQCQKITEGQYRFYHQPNGGYIGGGPYDVRSFFTYNSNDTVYYLQNDTFYILYDFSASIGDSWLLAKGNGWDSCDYTYATVVDTGSQVVASKNRRWIQIENNQGAGWYFQGRIYEGIGMVDKLPPSIHSTLFPRSVSCDNGAAIEYYMYDFHCFEDSLTPNYNAMTMDCEYYLIHSGIENSTELQSIEVFPNPTQNVFTLKWDTENNSMGVLNLYNILGECVYNSNVSDGEQKISIEHLSSGIYFYTLESNEETHLSGKIVKY